MSDTTDVTEITNATLIAADKVTGSAVYNHAGEKLGRIEDIMIDKISGHAAYAVLSFGGFLGIGDDHYPLPWNNLNYDVARGGYVVDVDKDMLKSAPSYKTGQQFMWTTDYGRGVDSFYNRPTTRS